MQHLEIMVGTEIYIVTDILLILYSSTESYCTGGEGCAEQKTCSRMGR